MVVTLLQLGRYEATILNGLIAGYAKKQYHIHETERAEARTADSVKWIKKQLDYLREAL